MVRLRWGRRHTGAHQQLRLINGQIEHRTVGWWNWEKFTICKRRVLEELQKCNHVPSTDYEWNQHPFLVRAGAASKGRRREGQYLPTILKRNNTHIPANADCHHLSLLSHFSRLIPPIPPAPASHRRRSVALLTHLSNFISFHSICSVNVIDCAIHPAKAASTG